MQTSPNAIPTAPTAKKGLVTFTLTLAAGCALIALFNVLVNPLGYYPTHLVRPLAWSSRSEKTEMMARTASPGALILGSSRVMKISPREVSNLWGETAFNAAVDSARAEDLYAMYAFAVEDCGWHPSDLIVGIDIEAFHDHVETDPRLVSNGALRAKLTREWQVDAYEKIFGALLSYQQTTSSLQAVRLTIRGFPPELSRFEPDGELIYIDHDRDIAAGTFHLDLAESIATYDGRFAGFSALSERRMTIFTSLIEKAHEAGLGVYLFLTPYHPSLLQHLRVTSDFDHVRALAVSYLTRLASRFNGVVAKDFTELASFGGDADSFYDGAHMQPANANRVLRALHAP